MTIFIPKTYRFSQGNYSVSDKGTCIGPFLTIKAVNRDTTSLSAGCRLLSRTLNKVYVSLFRFIEIFLTLI